MRAIEIWVLGYAVNAAWQVPLVFGAAWAAGWLVRRSGGGAGVEHRVWVGALVLEVVLPACRVDVAAVWRAVLGMLAFGMGLAGGQVRVAMGAGSAGGLGAVRLPETVLAGVAMAFAGVVVYGAVRLGWGVWRTETMRRGAEPVTLTGDAAESWRWCCGGLGSRRGLGFAVRAPEMGVSGMVSGPVTVGVLRPAVLVPRGFLETVDGEDLDALLEHEFAHVRRWDFLKNVVYEIGSLAVAWHPVVWMTRARVAESREMVCDAMAAEAIGYPGGQERYARSLLRLAAMLAHGSTARTLHAIGIFDANSFERRVMNLTMKRGVVRRTQRLAVAAVCAGVALGTCATALALRMEVAPTAVAVAGGNGTGSGVAVDPKVMAGQVLYKKMPVYPAEAKAKKDTVDGAVVLGATIGKDGTVEELRVVQSLREDYDRSALDAVKEWRYQPYLLNGEPVEVETTITVNYSTRK